MIGRYTTGLHASLSSESPKALRLRSIGSYFHVFLPTKRMYIGRFLIAGPGLGAYRVSSRSFPHRKIVKTDQAFQVVPTEDAPPTENPYVAYSCLREGADVATLGNGSHVDPIAEKLALGYPARDAITMGLLTLDFERDAYDTPRIAAVVGAQEAVVGIVRRDAVIVKSVEEPTLVATYEEAEPTPTEQEWTDPAEAARGIYALEYDHPVCAVAVAIEGAGGFETAIVNEGN